MRQIVLVLAVVAVAVPMASGCDDKSGASQTDKPGVWAEQLDSYGPPPRADEGVEIDGSARLVVLTDEETQIAGESYPTNPTVMEVAQRLQKMEGDEKGWIVWSDPELDVQRLARFVQKLEMAADKPTVHLAVDVSEPRADADIRGIRLAPVENPELSASNAWAVHAPESTPASDLPESLRKRRTGDQELPKLTE